MIVYDFDLLSTLFRLGEADPPLVVDTNAPLSPPASFQSLQPIARRNTQRLNARSGGDHIEFPQGNANNLRKPTALAGLVQSPRLLVFKR